MVKTKQKKTTALSKSQPKSDSRRILPFIEHLFELRRRTVIVAISVVVWSIAAYLAQKHVISVLLRPAHGQHFIYTSPLGGINFLFTVCLDIGIALSLPLIVFHVLRFIEPVMPKPAGRFVALGSLASGLTALGGIAFGYVIGLPAALNFLLHQFTSAQVSPLITIQSYLSFVTIYLLAAALMFQLPLLILFINRIKPLRPRRLFKYERYMIVAAFVIGFIMNPTPNLIDQLFVVLPIIASYQVGIALVWLVNRSRGEKTASFNAMPLPPLDALNQ